GGSASESSGSIRVLEALLGALVVERAADPALRRTLDDRQYGGECGPAGVHREEPTYEPDVYWRGPAWPQLTHLLWGAATRWSGPDLAGGLATRLLRGASRSGFAEYWHPDSGHARGARPQGWATLAVLVSRSRRTGNR